MGTGVVPLLPLSSILIVASQISLKLYLAVQLRQGRVVEQGTHEELLARAGIYRNLYELQYQSAGLGTAS